MTVTAELARISGLSTTALRADWRRAYRTAPHPKLGRDLLELGVAWKLQERALGGLGARAQRQLDALSGKSAKPADQRKPRQARIRPGARILREWEGQTHEILVADNGFLWRERTWRSLSAIAREITGARWSGPRFFGLDAGNGR